MNKKAPYLSLAILLAVTTSGFADAPNQTSRLSGEITHCPTLTELENTLCHRTGPFSQEQLKFPSCLILLNGKAFTFDDGIMWKVLSISPSVNNYTQLSFYSAYFNKNGVYCAYASKDQNTFLRLGFISQNNNSLMPVANGHWQQNSQSQRSNFKPGTFSSQYHYICQANSSDGDVGLCPLQITSQASQAQ